MAAGHLGELTQAVPPESVDVVLEGTGARKRRLRCLPPQVGVYFVLALGVFDRLGARLVWTKLVAELTVCVPEPSEKALRDLRQRIGPDGRSSAPTWRCVTHSSRPASCARRILPDSPWKYGHRSPSTRHRDPPRSPPWRPSLVPSRTAPPSSSPWRPPTTPSPSPPPDSGPRLRPHGPGRAHRHRSPGRLASPTPPADLRSDREARHLALPHLEPRSTPPQQPSTHCQRHHGQGPRSPDRTGSGPEGIHPWDRFCQILTAHANQPMPAHDLADQMRLTALQSRRNLASQLCFWTRHSLLTPEAAADLRGPWEKRAEHARLIPARVRRGIRNLRTTLPCPPREHRNMPAQALGTLQAEERQPASPARTRKAARADRPTAPSTAADGRSPACLPSRGPRPPHLDPPVPPRSGPGHRAWSTPRLPKRRPAHGWDRSRRMSTTPSTARAARASTGTSALSRSVPASVTMP